MTTFGRSHRDEHSATQEETRGKFFKILNELARTRSSTPDDDDLLASKGFKPKIPRGYSACRTPGHKRRVFFIFIYYLFCCFRRSGCVSAQENPGFSGFSRFRVDHRLHFVAFSFEIFIGGFNGHRETKLAKSEIANMIFEQKREETKSVVCSKTPKTLGFPGHWLRARGRKDRRRRLLV